MQFLEPLGLAGLAALVPIIALYFLKLKREERVVPSTLLWKKVIDDLQVNSPFQRLKYSLLLLMQLLLVALLAFALARPYLRLGGHTGEKILLLIDTSASMSTRDAGSDRTLTRLEAAIRDAQAKADDLRMNDEMALVTFDKDVRQLSKFTSDRGLLKQLLGDLQPRDLETNADEAFETALALCETERNAQVYVLSDGCFGNVKLLKETNQPVMGNVEDNATANVTDLTRLRLSNFRFISYGKDTSDNAAITQIDARARPVKKTDAEGRRMDVMETTLSVMIENYSPKPRDVVLKIFSSEGEFRTQFKTVALKGRPLRAETLEDVAATGSTSDAARTVEAFQLPQGFAGTVIASLQEARDSLTVDDTASVVIGSAEGLNVLIVSKGNYFLEKALGALRGLTLVKKTPEEFQKDWEQKGATAFESIDAFIFDEFSPISWTAGGAIFLGAIPPLPGFLQQEKPLEWPAVVDWDGGHPIMRYVRFGNITIAKAQQWKVPKTTRVVVEGGGGPLIVAVDNDRLRVVGISFDIFSTDWAYHRALPLFFRNVVPWLAEASPRKQPSAQRTGEPIIVPPGLGATSGTLCRPPGGVPSQEQVELSLDHSTFIKGTEKAGLYRLKDLSGGVPDRTYAVNLCNRLESDNAAQGALRVGEVNLASTPSAIEAKREIWRDLAFAVGVLLLLEWWVFHRRVGM